MPPPTRSACRAPHRPPPNPTPQGALCDDDAGVRTAAGGVFNVLFKSGGGSAMDSVIPALLSGLDSEAHSAQVGGWLGIHLTAWIAPAATLPSPCPTAAR